MNGNNEEMRVNVIYNETGISILEILELDFREYVKEHLKIHSTIY